MANRLTDWITRARQGLQALRGLLPRGRWSTVGLRNAMGPGRLVSGGLILGLLVLLRITAAASLTVTTTVDENNGNTSSIAALIATPGGSGISLREAIIAANNTTGGPHTVNVPAGTYTLSLGQITVSGAMTIAGAGAVSTIISGNNASRIFSISAATTLNDLRLTNGRVTGSGGAITHSAGALTLNNVDLINNQATGTGANGGAIAVSGGSLSLGNVTATGNSAQAEGGVVYTPASGVSAVALTGGIYSANTAGWDGGVLSMESGSLTINGSTFTNNTAGEAGGAVAHEGSGATTWTSVTASGNVATYFAGGVASLSSSASTTIIGGNFTNNQADADGGAFVFNKGNPNSSITGAVISNNRAGTEGGGISINSSGENLSLTELTITGNTAGTTGGGVHLQAGRLTVNRSLIASNVSTGTGGGIHVNTNSGTALTLTNVTIALNDATNAQAGGLMVGGTGSSTIALTNVTIAGNRSASAPSGLRRSIGTVNVRNTIISGNFNPNTSTNCSGTITSLGNNLENTNTCSFSQTSDQRGVNPLLSALADNGGPTQTMALGAGSPAINTGTATGAPTTDQRGFPRVGVPDIGAFEFITTVYQLSGTVFEDRNYGGGPGRSRAASGGVGVDGVIVELYDSSGAYLRNTTTAGGGAYSFTDLSASTTYHVRVASQTVMSGRTGTVNTLRGVLTFRTSTTAGTTAAVTDVVGGTNPAVADSGNASAGTSFNTSTYVFSAGLSGTAHAVAPVGVASANVTGVDFGFNFSTVVNTNNSGQGSLRQAITNANTLGDDGGLAVAGRTAGVEHLVFMIPNGTTGGGGSLNLAAGGLRSAQNLLLTSAGSYNVATIAPTSALPTISTTMIVDARTQPGWAGAPLVEINGASAGTVDGLTLTASNSRLAGFVINRFATSFRSGIVVSTGTGNTLAGNYVGTNAAGTARSANHHGIIVNSGPNTVGGTTPADRNLISGNTDLGLNLMGSSVVVTGNYVGTDPTGSVSVTQATGIQMVGNFLQVGGTDPGAGNLISGNDQGLFIRGNDGIVQGNIIGLNAAGTAALSNRIPIRMGSQFGTGDPKYRNTIGGSSAAARNVIAGNTREITVDASMHDTVFEGNYVGLNVAGTAAFAQPWPAIIFTATPSATVRGNTMRLGAAKGVVVNGNSQVSIRFNAIVGTTGLGIDLSDNGITANDGLKSAGQPNDWMDRPVLTRAVLGSNTLGVVGYVGSAALQSTFGNALVDLYVNDGGSGSVYLGTVTANADGEFAGVVSTAGISGLVAGSTQIVATATDAEGNTSEFSSAVATVALAALSNASFETGTGPGSSLRVAGGNSSTITGWTTTGIDVDYVGTGWTASNGSHSVELSGANRGGVAQVIQTTPGQAYQLTFAVAGNGTPRNLRVTAGTQVQTYNLTNALPSWSDRTISFVATSEATVLWFESLDAAASGPALDHVRLSNVLVSIAGTVFEDRNYGGRPGRSLASSGGVGVNGVTVELYDASGTYLSSTTTAGGGAYSFTNLPGGPTYHVRVASQTVQSGRTGSVNTLRGVLTYRTSTTSGTVSPVTDFVGGTDPAQPDPASASSGAALNPSTGVFTAGLSGTAHAVAPVGTGAANVTGVDFGFNFSTVVNTNDSGQGSLRQAITNANTLGGDTSLAVAGRTNGVEHLVFMIPNGTTGAGGSLGLAAGGLRTAQNLFATSAGSYNVATIAPIARLPDINQRLVLDARTQPGWAGAPVIEVSGEREVDGFTGLRVTASNSVLAGFVVNRFRSWGVFLAGGTGHTVAGNYIGTTAAGNAASPNATGGVTVATSSNTIGGSVMADRNVISGNTGTQVNIQSGANANTIRGNYIGLNAAGTAALPGASRGISVGSATGIVIGGAAAGMGNVIAGSSQYAISLSGSSGHSVLGNRIGTTADGSAVLATAGIGVWMLDTTSTTIGGIAPGEGNTIRLATAKGIVVTGNSQASIRGNSIHGSTGLGIDLVNDGISANDGAKTAGQPNQLMDAPVFTAASLSGNTLSVAGYVGSAAGQTLFGSAAVDVYLSDASSTHGSGQTYLGTLTADASGHFSGSLDVTGRGLTAGSSRITATATDTSGNTSEFGADASLLTLSGTVFEDRNYGGGPGRSLAASGGAPVVGARVELFDASGAFVSFTTTAADGRYSFPILTANTSYHVRVVSSSVLSTRTGATASQIGVMTFRTSTTAGTTTPVTDFVGGTNPAVADSGNASAGTSFNSSTYVFSAGLSGTAHAVAPVGVASANVTGVDFGFNFSTVVNTNDSGPGSLRQAIINANTLTDDASLAVAGRTAGVEHLVFMIPNGTTGAGGSLNLAAGGLRSAQNFFLTNAGSYNVATIGPASALPQVTGPLVIDAQAQPGWALSDGLPAPRIEINGTGMGAGLSGLTIAGNNVVLRGFVINRAPQAGLLVSGNGHVLQGNYIGLNAAGTARQAQGGVGINLLGATSNITLGGRLPGQGNVVTGGPVITAQAIVTDAAANVVIQGNRVGTNAAGTAGLSFSSTAILLRTGSTNGLIGGTLPGEGNVIASSGSGVVLQGSGHRVQGNLIGVGLDGVTALPNAVGVRLEGTGGHTVGGASAAERNIISGNTGPGVRVTSANNTVAGNYIGLDVTGTLAVGNPIGVEVSAAGNTIGGNTSASGNVISGNTGAGISVAGGGNTTTIRANFIGLNAAGTAAVPNTGAGISVAAASGVTIGGVSPGQGNSLRAGTAKGVVVTGDAQVSIRGNAISGTTGLGIDLANDGITANDGAKTAGQPNDLMDAPVFTSAVVAGTDLTVAGYVGVAAGDADFAGATVDVYLSDASNANGSGQTYLGTLTADGSGNFSGTLSGLNGLANGTTRITGVATDGAGNSSEFGANVLVGAAIAGTVFEDVNYGGGVGRSLASSGGVGIDGATVELYDSAGSYLRSTSTAGGGGYSFTGLSAGATYFVRVASQTVMSTRAGSASTLRGVLTYRTNSTAGAVSAVTDFVGGTDPAQPDPGSASSGAALNTSTFVFSAGLSGTAHAVAPVRSAAASVSGVDFGFNFSTVVNTNDSGQGSLRQFITNANALGKAGLAQAGFRKDLAGANVALPAGIETSIFMVPGGSAVRGIRAGVASQLTGGVAVITPVTQLPTVAAANIAIDGSTQTVNVGDTNSVLLGTGGTVGAQALALPQVPGPEVQITGNSSINNGLLINGANAQVRGLSVWGFGAAGDNSRGAVFFLSTSDATAELNVLGATATSTSDPRTSGASQYGNSLYLGSVSTATVRHNFVGYGHRGLALIGGSGITASGNEVVGPVAHALVEVWSTSNHTLTGNLVRGHHNGVAFGSGSNNVLLENNTITAHTDAGVLVTSNTAAVTGVTLRHNLITANTGLGRGVRVDSAMPHQITITRNRIFANSGLGIDLMSNGVTANDGTTTPGEPNGLMDHPVFTSASLSGSELSVAGYVGSAAGQSTFAGATVEVFASDNDASGFGEGQTYLGTLTADGNGNFSGTIDVTGQGVANGTTRITGTATDGSGNTSEFGANALVGLTIAGTVFEDVTYGGGPGRSLASSGGTGIDGATVELYDASGSYLRSTATADGGRYSFVSLSPGVAYHVRVASQTVSSTRSGTVGTLRGVLTYRTSTTAGTVSPVTDFVGGTDPSQEDPPSAGSGAVLNTGTGVFSAGLAGTAHAVAPVGVDSASVAGVDFGFNFSTVVNTRDSGQGSLRQALTNANTLGNDGNLAQAGRTSGIEHLIFMIPNGSTGAGGALGLAAGGLRSSLNAFSGGIASIAAASALPTISTPMIVDARTQPGWASAPLIEINGAGAGAGVNGLNLQASNGTLAGLVINRFSGTGVVVGTGTGNTLAGNYIGTNAAGTAAAANGGRGVHVLSSSNIIGGGSSAARNVIAGNAGTGIWVEGSSTVIAGNLIGLGADGTTAISNATGGVYVGAVGAVIGGASAGERNVISANGSSSTGHHGVEVCAGDTTVRGNYVGTDVTGSLGRGNGNDGVSGCPTFTGTVQVLDNLISGNGRHGVFNWNNNSAAPGLGGTWTVLRNVIGRNAGDTGHLPNGVTRGPGAGVTLEARGSQVGDGTAANGNLIAGNSGPGVLVRGANSNSHSIRGNRIRGNTGIGIDLVGNGITANDGLKPTGQPNLLMDSPVFTSARARGNQLTVAGYVGAAAGQSPFGQATVDVYASDVSSTHGSGQTYLGTLTADASGNFSGTVTMPVAAVAVGTRLTGTATDAAGNTSEFGANFANLLVDLIVNDVGDAVDASPGDGLCLTAGGVCTLRAAIAEFNAQAAQAGGTPTVAFGLPGCSPSTQAACVISPTSGLPALNRAMVIDGQTQPGWVLSPIVELRGTLAGATHGLTVSAAGSTVRGLVIGGFGTSGAFGGIYVDAHNTTVEGNFIGLTADGAAARPNGAGNTASGGIYVNSGTGVVIGGSTAAQRNVLSGNGGAGVWVAGGTPTIIGNYIGTNASGLAAVSNGRWGVHIFNATGGTRVGGVGQGNVISGNTLSDAGGVFISGGPVTVQGNIIGLNASGSAALPNGNGVGNFVSGIDVRAGSGHVIGGGNPGEGNTIAGNNGHGVRVHTGVLNARISGNSLYANNWLGIDLGGDGVTPNNGSTSGGQINNGMDHPVVTGAGISGTGTSITVNGYVGTGTGQAAFAGARVEVFRAAADPPGFGEGQVYLGFLTADANGRFSGTLAIPAGAAVVGDAITATSTDLAGNTSEFGPNWTSTTVAGLSPAGFNAFESDTPAGSLTGVLRTRVAGAAGGVDLIALDSSGTGQHAGFTGTVALAWLDARDDSGAISGSCRSSWTVLGSAGSVAFSGNARVSANLTPPANATRSMRLQMVYNGPMGTVTACSGDAFAVLPAQLAWIGATDGDSATDGTARNLDNLQASGGVVHRAGRPFTVRAQALDATGALMTQYDGSPSAAVAACLLPAGCTAGTLSAPALTAVGGLITGQGLTYAEVGAFSLQLTDDAYAAVDASDTPAVQRRLQSPALAVGRFVPDHYRLALVQAPQLATQQGACARPGLGYTFVGQTFGWAQAPQWSVTAHAADGSVTALWQGSLRKLDPDSHLTRAVAATAAQGLVPALMGGGVTLADHGPGAVLLSTPGDQFLFSRDPAQPVASFSPQISLQLNVQDSSEQAVAGNGSIGAQAPLTIGDSGGIAFSQGGNFHYARLQLHHAFGDLRYGVAARVELQRYTARGWMRLSEDDGCISIPVAAVAFHDAQGGMAGQICGAPPAAPITLRGGAGLLRLPRPASRQPGQVQVQLHLGATGGAGQACSNGVAVAPLAQPLPYLLTQDGSLPAAQQHNPNARVIWGRQQRPYLQLRELF